MAEISKVRFGGVDYDIKSITDTSLSEAGTPADAESVGNTNSGIRDTLSSAGTNLFAGEIAEYGDGFVAKTGVITENSNYKYAKYIVKKGAGALTVDSIYVNGSAASYAAFAFFDNSNNLLGIVANTEINQTESGNTFSDVNVDIPLNTKYVLITFGSMKSSEAFPTITEQGFYVPNTVKHVINTRLTANSTQQFYFHTKTENLGNYAGLSFNAKIKTCSRVLRYEIYFTGYDENYTGRVFQAYKTGLTKGIDDDCITIAENFTNLANSIKSKYWTGVVVTLVYDGASEESGKTGLRLANKYMLTMDYCLLNGISLEKVQYPASTAIATIGEHNEPYNPMYGGYLCAIGDSLTAVYYKSEAESWVSLIAGWNSMRYENLGISGNPMTKTSDYTVAKVMSERVDDMDGNKDYTHIFVMGGANDFNYRVPIGENADTEITTFKGAVNHIITVLTSKYPTAKIVFATTYRRNEAYLDKPYADAMMEVCKLRSIPCLNNYENSGVQFFDENWMRIFGAINALGNNHLNAAGDLFVAPRFEHALKYGIN